MTMAECAAKQYEKRAAGLAASRPNALRRG
jgi:hypothetical protein